MMDVEGATVFVGTKGMASCGGAVPTEILAKGTEGEQETAVRQGREHSS